jgi:predicted DNA-binding ribbon-helix-helix protein
MTFRSKLLISVRCKIPAEAAVTPATGKKVVKHGKAKSGSLSRTGTSLVSRDLVICGRKTTVCLEDKMWGSLNVIAEHKGCSVHDLCSLVCEQKTNDQGVSSAIRMFLMLYYRNAATEAGHAEAGHFNQKPRRKAQFTRPLNTLRSKAGYGGLDEAILNKAEARLENNGVDFPPLAETYLAALMRVIVQARNPTPGENGETLIVGMLEPTIELKAGGAMCGYPLVTRIANKLIQFLEVIAEPDKDAIEIVLAFHTTMRTILMGRITGSGGSHGEDLMQALEAACLRFFERHDRT